MNLKARQIENFYKFVEKIPGGCWLFKGSINPKGYGLKTFKLKGKVTKYYAHRLSYELHKGQIPEDLQIDHLCRVRNCCNPDHLEAVTPKENTLRGFGATAINHKKIYCIKNHLLDDANTYIARGKSGSSRHCRICRRITKLASYRRVRDRQLAARGIEVQLVERRRIIATLVEKGA